MARPMTGRAPGYLARVEIPLPIIQTPEDMVMLQELVWKVRPDVIIECGVAHDGSLVLFASLFLTVVVWLVRRRAV